MREFEIMPNDAGQRLDKFLQKSLPALPPSLMHKYIRLKRIKVNGKRSEISYKLVQGDVLSLYINDEFFAKPNDEKAFLALTPKLSVLYEDDQILLCDKRPGVVVHEDDDGTVDTLINQIKAYLYQNGRWDPDTEHSFTPALCNRIDRYTGGIVIAAKTAEALRILNEKIRLHQLQKSYLCLVHGRPTPRTAVLTDSLFKNSETNTVSVVSDRHPGAKTASMRYTVLETRGNVSLLECELFTGRTHQIRVQLASRGHALLGDTKYGIAAENRVYGLKHQALYSYKLRFAFEGDNGCLDYLNRRVFQVEQVPFLDLFHKIPQK